MYMCPNPEMRLATVTWFVLTSCISLGQSLSMLPECTSMIDACSSPSDCPELYPVCTSDGSCCLGSTNIMRRSLSPECPGGLPRGLGYCHPAPVCIIGECINGICCMKPLKNTTVVTKKLGTCPETKFNIICPAVLLPDECSKDEECPTGEKCCYVGCGPRRCHTAVPKDSDMQQL